MRKWFEFISLAYPTNIQINNPTSILSNSPTNNPTNLPTSTPANISTNLSGNVPTAAPSFILPAKAAEETLDDLSPFQPIDNCYIDYAFRVGITNPAADYSYRSAFMVSGKYDLNGDGIEDNISIVQRGRNNKLSYIEINQIKLSFDMDNPMDGEAHIIDLDNNDPYLEVVCYDDGPSWDPVFIIFRYDGSSIYELGSIDVYASIDGKGRLVSFFDRSIYLKPEFCSAWYEIIDNILVRKSNRIDKYLGQMYDFAGGDAYFIPYEVLPEYPDYQWDEMKHFEACKIKLIDTRGMSSYYIELPTGERGLLYFWVGD